MNNNGVLYNRIKDGKPFKKWDTAVFIALAVIIVLSIIITYPHKSGTYAQIYGSGRLLKVMPLEIDDEYIYFYDQNHKNVITVKDGKISVTYSDCNEKICVNHIPVNLDGSVIVCLPHKLVIVVKGDSDSDGII